MIQADHENSALASVMILAGGASRRMGENKAFVKVGGMSMLERIMAIARSISDDVFLIANDVELYQGFGLPIVTDVQPGGGPLVGLYSGLLQARYELTLLLACDMPFVSAVFLRGLIELAPGYDVVVPRTGGRLHPLHALYRRSTCLPVIAAALARGERRTIAFFEDVRVLVLEEDALQRLDPTGIALMNVNTPQELARARALAAEMAGGKHE